MKRIGAFFTAGILLLTCLCFCACKDAASGEQEVLDSYGFVQDFSDRQGYRGWWYLFGDSAEGFKPMTYHEDFGEYRGEDYWSRLSVYDSIPGLNSEIAVGFSVPKTCTLSVSSTIYRHPPEGFGIGQDGVWYYSYCNSFTDAEELLFSEMIVDTEITVHTLTYETQVQEGDMLYFVINSRTNQSNDNCVLDIRIDLGGAA